MTHARLIQWLALAAAGILIAAASQLTPRINEGRRALNMIGGDSPVESAPPEYAFAIQAFGAFRSLLTDIAFIRAEEYKQQGKYYDAMQLASWICKLQPRFPAVWEFHAWNMAWNISVTTYTPEERWNWVYNGVKLLRDEGLRYNPRAVNIYKQLAWIFVNKMSETTDEMHQAYKRNWAWRMHLVLGPPPDPVGPKMVDATLEGLQSRLKRTDPLAEAARVERERKQLARIEKGQAPLPEIAVPGVNSTSGGPEELTPADVRKQASIDRMKQIVESPRSLPELFANFPETREMTDALRDIGVFLSDDALKEDDYFRPEGLAYTFFARYRRLVDTPALLSRILKNSDPDPDEANRARFGQILGIAQGNPAGEALVRFLQRKVLSEVYKLDPAHLQYLCEQFGPMDWRVVDSQSLYWVTQAIIQSKETLHTFRNDKTNTARLIFFSLRNLYLRNRLVFEPYFPNINLSYLNPRPDLDFIEPMHQAYVRYAPMIDPNPEQSRGGAGAIFNTGHINFLTEAIRLLYFADRTREAYKYYDYLRDTYGLKPDGTADPNYLKPLHDFVMDSFWEITEGTMDQREAQGVVNNFLRLGLNELADGNSAQYTAYTSKALDFYSQYNDRERTAERTVSKQLPPFVDMQTDAVTEILKTTAISPEQTYIKAQLWTYLPIYLKQRVYDDVSDHLRAEADGWGFDPAKAFGEPPGMDDYRKQEGPRGPEDRDTGVRTKPVQ
ncbi:MAG: hypothetical protein U1D55_09200 [Phycisphaerae bacterium]